MQEMLCFLENLFDFTYYFVNILTYHASVFPLTAGRLLLFNNSTNIYEVPAVCQALLSAGDALESTEDFCPHEASMLVKEGDVH